MQVAREDHDLNHDRRHAGAGEQRRNRAHGEGQPHRAASGLAEPHAAAESREVHHDHVEHRQAEHDEQRGDAEVEPRRRVDRAERAGGEDDDDAEDAVDEGHGATVDGAEEEAAAALRSLRPGADDREVDGNHRQHARRQVQRQAAEKHEREDGERSLAFEEPGLLDSAFGVADELQERILVHVSARRAEHIELVEEFDDICRQGRCGPAFTAAAAGALVEGRVAGAGAGGSEGGAVPRWQAAQPARPLVA